MALSRFGAQPTPNQLYAQPTANTQPILNQPFGSVLWAPLERICQHILPSGWLCSCLSANRFHPPAIAAGRLSTDCQMSFQLIVPLSGRLSAVCHHLPTIRLYLGCLPIRQVFSVIHLNLRTLPLIVAQYLSCELETESSRRSLSKEEAYICISIGILILS